MKIEKKVGAVVYARDGEDTYFALVHDVFGHWTLSKGGLEEGESDDAGLKRIIKEDEASYILIPIFQKIQKGTRTHACLFSSQKSNSCGELLA